MRNLSKSKIIACRQCPKRMWLEIHKPELRDDTPSQAAFDIGNQVGEVARKVFDPQGKGILVDIEVLGHAGAFEATKQLLAAGEGPVFEAGFSAAGGLAYADVMLPDRTDGVLRWKMIEVKSSTSVKDYHHDDIAVQAFIAKEAGVPLVSVSLAYIDRDFVYFKSTGYSGILNLFKQVEMGDETADRHEEVRQWFAEAQKVAAMEEAPAIETGDQCHSPFACGFLGHCNRDKVKPEFPLSSLPSLHRSRRKEMEDDGLDDVRNVPDKLLSVLQQRVKDCSISGEPYFDAESTAAELAPYGFPAYFLDFETIAFAVPRWEGTRPYQAIPFQLSLHIAKSEEQIIHRGYLDLNGADPRRGLAQFLLRQCGSHGPIFAYNAGFESRVIRELADAFDDLSVPLRRIASRLVDLLPIARRHYYHPSQHGSWSLKAVLPTVCPDLSYKALNGVQDGNMAQQAYMEAIDAAVDEERCEEINRQLMQYCQLDTLALVRIWQSFRGRRSGMADSPSETMAQLYVCKYCGLKSTSREDLTNRLCPSHPLGSNEGAHILKQSADFRGRACCFCGQEEDSPLYPQSGPCPENPNGLNHGEHLFLANGAEIYQRRHTTPGMACLPEDFPARYDSIRTRLLDLQNQEHDFIIWKAILPDIHNEEDMLGASMMYHDENISYVLEKWEHPVDGNVMQFKVAGTCIKERSIEAMASLIKVEIRDPDPAGKVTDRLDIAYACVLSKCHFRIVITREGVKWESCIREVPVEAEP